jgi:peptidylprolyl isomerase
MMSSKCCKYPSEEQERVLIKPSWIMLLGIAFLGVALILPSAKQRVRTGDRVTMDFTLTLEDGTVYDSSIGQDPLQVIVGQGQLLPAFEDELAGMRVGESKTFTLPPEKAYGNYRPEMIGTFDRSMLPEGMEPEIGKQIQAKLKDGTQLVAVITSFTDTSVTLDANHPLAGQTLTFDIELLGIGNIITPASPYPTILGWLILASGAMVFAFRNLRHRDWPRLVPVHVTHTPRRRHR